MTHNDRPQLSLQRLAFYQSQEHPCSYLPGCSAASLFADPTAQMTTALYSRLAGYGFRRSGAHVYRPSCPGCAACIPVRIPVRDYHLARWERRIWKGNADLRVIATEPAYHEQHFRLYRRYIQARHPGGGMDDPDARKYLEFLSCAWCETRFYEFRHGMDLLAVAVVDHLEHGLSAVYTFYEPALPTRSLGTYAILWQIDLARRLGKESLYLGYWIEQCPKMSYKGRFRPLEIWQDNQWVRLERARPSL